MGYGIRILEELILKETKMKNFKNYFNITSVVVLLLFFSACKKENACDCIKRTGSIITETRTLTGFDKVWVEDNLNVFITQDSSFDVEIEAGKNIVPLIKAEVGSDGTLTLQNKNRCNWTRSYDKPFNVYIKMPVIKYITSNGSGDIKSVNTITTSALDVETKSSGNIELTLNNTTVTSHMFGYGDVTLHGVSQNHLCSIGGDGFLYCSDLVTNYTYLHTFTDGFCYVNATNLLTCVIDKKGDVFCYGHPATIEKTQNGTGQLHIE